NGLTLELTGGRVATDHVDIFFMFFIALAVYLSVLFAEQRKPLFNILAGVAMGLAVLCKWLPALIVAPIWLLIIHDTGKFSIKEITIHLGVLVFVSLIVFAPWQIYIHNTYPFEAQFESEFNRRHITEVLDGRGGPWYFHLQYIGIIFGELIYLPLIGVFLYFIKVKLDLKVAAIAFWSIVPLLFFTVVATKMQAYTMMAAPAFFLLISWFWWSLFTRLDSFKWKWLYISILLLLIVLPIRYSIERMKLFTNIDRDPQWTKDLRFLDERIKSDKAVVFNVAHAIAAMYYSDLTVYSHIPSIEDLKNARQAGFEIYIADDGKIPENIKNQGVTLISLE
nr:glycosyltransferase family 39 protein [Bacteroidota bacterium]